MTRSLCLPPSFPHDVRLLRMLNAHELKHFLLLLCYAGTLRDRTFVPARRREELRLTLGVNAEKLQKRLDRWAAPGIELIETQPDGGVLITYLLDQDDEEHDDAPPYSPPGQTALNGNGHAPRLQRRRRYSTTPEAERARLAYHRRRAEQDGETSQVGYGEVPAAGPDGDEGREVFPQNLTPGESKPHAVALGFGQDGPAKPHGPGAGLREVSRARVGHSDTVSGDSKNFESSGYGNTVADGQNLTQNLTPPSGQSRILPGHPEGNPPRAAAPLTAAPPPRRHLRPQDVPNARQRDVQLVMTTTRENPDYRNFWLALWKHCHESGRLDVWDQGVAIFAEAARTRPPAGPGSIATPAKWLKGTILRLLDAAGVAYVSKGGAPPVEDVGEEEAEQIRLAIARTKALWAEEGGEGGEP